MVARRARTPRRGRLPARPRPARRRRPVAEAYAVPGKPGRVVVSTGMLSAHDPADHETLLAHERSHLEKRHRLFVALAPLGAAARPLFRPLATTVGCTAERRADEDAAAPTGDRQWVAPPTSGKVTPAARRSPVRGPTWFPHAAPAILSRLRPGGPGPVPRRAARTTPRSRTWTTVAFVGLGVAAARGTAEAAHDLETLLELAKHAAADS
ncbi:M48 family metalloprotease [Streptomyces sp. NPDC059525]|uniref:M48 family metalloprotease n=1 Tax=Streptomyces sp. NPDC059525 TaxID=3346857 RepID=UPI0036CEF4AC